MKCHLIYLIFLIFWGCSGESQSFQHPLGYKVINCDRSSLELMRVEENSNNKTEVNVSALDYLYPLRLLASFNDDPKGKIFTSIRRDQGIDLDLFKKETIQLVINRKQSFFATHAPAGKIDTLDPRMFLDKGDYVLTASKGCENETSIVLDQELAVKYIYTFGIDLIILKRDTDGRIESTIDSEFDAKNNDYQYFTIDGKISHEHQTEEMIEYKLLVTSSMEYDIEAVTSPFKRIKLDRDRTLVFKHRDSTYIFFELTKSPYYFNLAMPKIPTHAHGMPRGYLIDNRRGIAFSFLENQVELEKNDVVTTL